MNGLKKYCLRKVYWLRDWSIGAPMWKEFKEVLWMIKHPEESYTLRFEKLSELLSYAKLNTSFYKQYLGVDKLEDFPVMNKQLYREHYEEIRVSPQLIPGQVGEVHIQKTSGSTGTPFEIPQDTHCRIRRIATIKAMNELIGFHSFDTLLHLRAFAHYWGGDMTIRYDKKQNIVYANNANLTKEKIQLIVDAVNKYEVEFIRGYVTSIDMITQYIVEHQIELKTRPTFITGGELLTSELQKRILGIGCHVISQYANEENGVFGQSEIDSVATTFKLCNANVITEILKIDSDEPASRGELGRIVITDLTNKAFPMIRYDIGDVAMIGDVAKDGTILSIVNFSGRSSDLILRTDGSKVDMFNSIPKEIYNNPEIKQWQFIQKTDRSYLLRLCMDRTFFANGDCSWGGVVYSLKKILGNNADVQIQIVNDLPILTSGKRKVVINEYSKKSNERNKQKI